MFCGLWRNKLCEKLWTNFLPMMLPTWWQGKQMLAHLFLMTLQGSNIYLLTYCRFPSPFFFNSFVNKKRLILPVPLSSFLLCLTRSTDDLPPRQEWLRIDTVNLTWRHFVNEPFPAFHIRLVQRNGGAAPRKLDGTLDNIRARLTVFNKWAEVTDEVLRGSTLITLVDGCATVSDWMFKEISFNHGGSFIVRITALDFTNEVMEYSSHKIEILSEKAFSKFKRESSNNGSIKYDSDADDMSTWLICLFLFVFVLIVVDFLMFLLIVVVMTYQKLNILLQATQCFPKNSKPAHLNWLHCGKQLNKTKVTDYSLYK